MRDQREEAAGPTKDRGEDLSSEGGRDDGGAWRHGGIEERGEEERRGKEGIVASVEGRGGRSSQAAEPEKKQTSDEQKLWTGCCEENLLTCVNGL
jgi:hypothetical protein